MLRYVAEFQWSVRQLLERYANLHFHRFLETSLVTILAYRCVSHTSATYDCTPLNPLVQVSPPRSSALLLASDYSDAPCCGQFLQRESFSRPRRSSTGLLLPSNDHSGRVFSASVFTTSDGQYKRARLDTFRNTKISESAFGANRLYPESNFS